MLRTSFEQLLRFSNSCISAKYCPIITNHTSMKSYWFCGPGSRVLFVLCWQRALEDWSCWVVCLCCRRLISGLWEDFLTKPFPRIISVWSSSFSFLRSDPSVWLKTDGVYHSHCLTLGLWEEKKKLLRWIFCYIWVFARVIYSPLMWGNTMHCLWLTCSRKTVACIYQFLCFAFYF